MIRIILLGDIVGKPGVRAVTQQIETIRRRWQPDLILANAENAANGTGLTPSLYQRLCRAGIDGMTLGDHVYKKKQIIGTLERESNILRPANLPAPAIGRTWMRVCPKAGGAPAAGEQASSARSPAGASKRWAEGPGPNVYVVTVLGRLFMGLPANDPFATARAVIAQLPEPDPIVLLEIHAEATSEKQAMGWSFNGEAAAVFGTHTHVPTNDARILPTHVPERPDASRHDVSQERGGTAYISDLGMCGPVNSVLGRRVDRVLYHMTTSMPLPFDVAEDNPQVQGAYVEIDERTRRARHIEPISLPADVAAPPFTQ